MSASPRTVRVALVGAGAIAQVAHLPILSRMRGVTLAGLYDTDRAKARAMGELQPMRPWPASCSSSPTSVTLRSVSSSSARVTVAPKNTRARSG